MARLVKVLMAGIRTSDLPVSSGLGYAYNPGTTTPGTFMYTAPDLITATANPVVLDAEGRAEVYVSDTANFRLRVRNAADTTTIIDVDPCESDNAALTSAITVDTTNDDALTAGAGSLLRAWMQFIWEGLNNQSVAATAADLRYLHHQSVNGTASTGAVGRYPYQVFSDHWNVMDFGAVGDGVADDTAAIQAAIAACAARGGGAVYFPGATYRCAAQLTIANLDNVSLIGDGPGSIIRQAFTTAALLAITGTSDTIEIASLQFQGGGSTLTTTALGISVASGIPASLRPPVNIHDCMFSGSADGTGFNVAIEALGTRGSVNNCYFQRLYGTNSFAVRTNTGNSWSITNCHVLGADGAGTRCVGGVGNSVTATGYRTRVVGCHIEGTSGAGVRFLGPVGGEVSGCTFYQCQGAAVRLTSARDIAVTGNLMDSCQYGVLVDEDGATTGQPPSGFAITGNHIINSTVNGVRCINATDSALYTPRRGVVSGNSVRTTTQSGILLSGADEVLVSGNMVSDCVTNATYPGIEVQTSLPAATHRGGSGSAIIGNCVTDTSTLTWVAALRIQRFGGGGVDNVSTTVVLGNSFALPISGANVVLYGVATSSPLMHGNTRGFNSTDQFCGKPWIDMPTSGVTMSTLYSGGVVTNRGAVGAVTITLPALTTGITDGMNFTFIRFAGQNFSIASTNTIVRRDGTSGTVALTGTTDQSFHVVAMGVFWYADVVDYTT